MSAVDEVSEESAVMISRDLAANARDDAPADTEDLDYYDEPCGEGMCRCSCGQGCVCGCECPGDPDERPLSDCDHCEGGDRCACAIGQGARYDECDCGPTGDEVAQ